MFACKCYKQKGKHTHEQAMAVRLLQHAADAGNMLDRKAEHHKIHPCLTHNVVFLKVMLYSLDTKKTVIMQIV